MLIATLAAAVATAPVPGPSYLPSPGQTYEVVRATDRTIPCGELIAEINGLTMQLQSAQAQQTQQIMELAQSRMGSAGVGAMAGRQVAGMAAGLVPFGGMALSVGQAAAARSQSQRMSQAMTDSMQTAQLLMPGYQRLEHLSTLYRDRAC